MKDNNKRDNELSKRQVKSEKTGWLTIATACITTGIQQTCTGNIKIGNPEETETFRVDACTEERF